MVSSPEELLETVRSTDDADAEVQTQDAANLAEARHTNRLQRGGAEHAIRRKEVPQRPATAMGSIPPNLKPSSS